MTLRQRIIPIRDPEYLAQVRQTPCIICGLARSDAHHMLRTPEKGMGRKSGDNWVTPLCSGLHGHHVGPDSPHGHGNETVWFCSHGIYRPHAIAEALYAARDDLTKMQKIAMDVALKVRMG